MADANQAAASVELDDEAKRLKLEQIKAESRKAILEAGAATGKSLTPALDTDAIKSALSVGETGGSTLTTMIASDQLSRVAQSIADVIANEIHGGTVILIDDLSIADDDTVHLLITDRINEFSRAFMEAKQAYQPSDGQPRVKSLAVAGLGAAAAAISATSAFASLIGGLLKTETTLGSRSVTVSRTALLAEIMQRLHSHRITVELPGLRLVKHSATLSSLDAAVRLRYELEHLMTLTQYQVVEFRLQEIERLSKSVQELRTSWAKLLGEAKLTDADKVRGIIETEEARLTNLTENDVFQEKRALNATAKSLNTAFDAFVTSISAAPQGSGLAPLGKAILRERFTATDEVIHLLSVDVTASGGEVITHRGVPWRKPTAAFLGAVEVSFVLATTDGHIAHSGRVSKYAAANFDFEKSALTMRPHSGA